MTPVRERQRSRRAGLARRGLKEVDVVVPIHCAAGMKALAAAKWGGYDLAGAEAPPEASPAEVLEALLQVQQQDRGHA